MRSDPMARSGWLRWGGLAVALLLWLGLALSIGDGGVGPDGAILDTVGGAREPGATSAMLAITQLGGFWVLTSVTSLLALLLALRAGGRRAALFLVGSVAGAALLVVATKWLVARPRPDLGSAVYDAGGYSFPSGHSMVTAAFFLSAVLMAFRTRPRLTRAIAAVALVLVPLVGFTRVYLGVHYPTDVLAGWALGIAWVLGAYAWYRRAFL